LLTGWNLTFDLIVPNTEISICWCPANNSYKPH
jgi:hypothetical protein